MDESSEQPKFLVGSGFNILECQSLPLCSCEVSAEVDVPARSYGVSFMGAGADSAAKYPPRIRSERIPVLIESRCSYGEDIALGRRGDEVDRREWALESLVATDQSLKSSQEPVFTRAWCLFARRNALSMATALFQRDRFNHDIANNPHLVSPTTATLQGARHRARQFNCTYSFILISVSTSSKIH